MSSAGQLSELDSLRSQVADLSCQLAERDCVAQDSREQSEKLRAIVEGTAAETGEEFFAALVTHLTAVLNVRYAVIGEVQGGPIKTIHTLAVSVGGVLTDNFEYALSHTPCANALTQTCVCVERDVQATFPQFQRLVDLEVESYCAVPIRMKSKPVIGLLVVMDTKPLEHSDSLQSLLKVFAPRVAAEFERRRVERECIQALADLQNVMETIPDILFILNTQGNLVKWNQRLRDVTGYSPEELFNKPALAFVSPEDRSRADTAIQRALTEGCAELEGHLLTKDHHLIPYHWTGAVLKNCHGESIGIVGIGRDVVEKKRVEAALRASEERYRALYDETPTMYFTLATDGTVRSVNRFGAEQLGYQAEELIGHSVLCVFHEQDRETVAANLAECLATPEATRHWEFRKVRKDGSIIWVQETVRVDQSSSGETIVSVTCEDVTERKQAEQGLKFFRTLLDHIDDSIEILDPQGGRFLDGNAKAASNLGYTRDELLGLTVPDIDPLVTEPVFTGLIRGLRDAPARLVLDSIHRRKDGTTFPVEVSAQLIRLDKEYLVAIVRDITERKQAEQALKQSEARYHALYDDTPTMYFTLATDGTVLSVNRFGAEQLGYRVEELVGHSVLSIFYDEDKETVAASLSECLTTPERMRNWEFRKVRKNRTIIWVRETVRVGTSFSGETIVLVTCEDITERKRVEEALRQRERDLQAALQERERISQDLHDGILQSLFAVGLTLETAKSMMAPKARKTSGLPLDQAIKQLNLVMREIRHFITGLGSDLLQGKDLPTALQHMLASLTENQAMRVRLAVEDRAAKAVSTEQLLHLLRVIQEAVSNCIRHGRAREARVSLKMLKQGVRLSIRDNGCGFNPASTKGSGHGLRNMAARAQKIGGRLTVLSKMNEGTRVVLDLPKEASNVPC